MNDWWWYGSAFIEPCRHVPDGPAWRPPRDVPLAAARGERVSYPLRVSCEIRVATRDDVPLVLQFIHELAAYERLQSEVVATETDLERWLFGARPVAEAAIAREDGVAVGFALFFPVFSTFLGKPGIYLEDLFVRESARGRGIGRALLSHVARVAVARGWGRVEWSVLDWNEPAIAFYRRLGARGMDEWRRWRIAGDALMRLAAQEAAPAGSPDNARSPRPGVRSQE